MKDPMRAQPLPGEALAADDGAAIPYDAVDGACRRATI
jgi:hypothetical protein